MGRFIWEKEAEDFLENFLKLVAKITQTFLRDKIVEECYRIAARKSANKISKEILLEAIRDAIPHDYDPLVAMVDDPEGFKKMFTAMFEGIETYKKIPVEIKRWNSPFHHEKVKLDTRPEETAVIAFNASPRKGGNTDILIDEALKGARSVGAKTEKYYIQDLKIGYCIGCRVCKDKILPTTCTVIDDMTPLYDKVREAQCIIIGFPIYTGRECGQLAVFFDRWDAFEGPGMKHTFKPDKRAMVIGTWGYPKVDHLDHQIRRIIDTLNVHKIQTVEAVSASGFEGLLHGLDENKRGIVLRNPEGLKQIFRAGKCLVTGIPEI